MDLLTCLHFLYIFFSLFTKKNSFRISHWACFFNDATLIKTSSWRSMKVLFFWRLFHKEIHIVHEALAGFNEHFLMKLFFMRPSQTCYLRDGLILLLQIATTEAAIVVILCAASSRSSKELSWRALIESIASIRSSTHPMDWFCRLCLWMASLRGFCTVWSRGGFSEWIEMERKHFSLKGMNTA